MEDPKSTTSFLSLPPGCRFYPSEQELLSCYLPHRNSNLRSSTDRNGGIDLIGEINLYNYNPFDLPELTCFRFGYKGRRRHWYCYTEKVDGGGGEKLRRRKAGCGYWMRKGKVRDVMGNAGKVVLGRRSCFVFYMDKLVDERNKSYVKTDWFMLILCYVEYLSNHMLKRMCLTILQIHVRKKVLLLCATLVFNMMEAVHLILTKLALVHLNILKINFQFHLTFCQVIWLYHLGLLSNCNPLQRENILS